MEGRDDEPTDSACRETMHLGGAQIILARAGAELGASRQLRRAWS